MITKIKRHLLLIVCVIVVIFSFLLALMVSACSRRDVPREKVKTNKIVYVASPDEINSTINLNENNFDYTQDYSEEASLVQSEKNETTVGVTSPTQKINDKLSSNNVQNQSKPQTPTYNSQINPNADLISNSVILKPPKPTTAVVTSPSNDEKPSDVVNSTNPTVSQSTSIPNRKWVVDKPAYDEEVNEYENRERAFCDDCGADITDDITNHIEKELKENNGKGTYTLKMVNIKISSTVIHHDEVGHYEDVD